MSRSFGQLWYTWAIHGLEGRSKLQIRGISTDLSAGDPRIVEAARRLCRYEPPPRVYDPIASPVSFGWISWGDRRFIFRRAATGTGPQGQPAAFGAHVLVGPVDQCPLGAVAALWGSRHWLDVDDGGTDLGLSMVDPEDLAAVALRLEAPRPGLVEHFLAEILGSAARQKGILIAADPVCIAAVAREAIDRSPPNLLEGLSFSTYEPADSSGFFDICGVPRDTAVDAIRLGDERGDDAASRAARAIVSGDRAEVAAATAVATGSESADAGTSFDRMGFVVMHEALRQLGTGGPIDSVSLSAALGTAAGTSLILRDQISCDVVARRVVSEDARVLQALGRSAPMTADAGLARLGAAVARTCCAQGRVDGRLISLLSCVDHRLYEAWGEGIRKAMSGDLTLVGIIDGEVRRTLLLFLASRRVQKGALLEALRATPATQLSTIAGDTGIPLRWRVISVTPHIGCLIGDDVARRMLTTEPTAAREFADAGLSPVLLAGLVAGLGRAERNDAAINAASSPSLTPAEKSTILESAAASWDSGSVFELFERLAQSRLHYLMEQSPLCEMAVGAAVHAIRIGNQQGQPGASGTAEILWASRTAEADTWIRLLNACRQHFGGVPQPDWWFRGMSTARDLVAVLPAERLDVAAEYLFQNAALDPPSPEQFALLADWTARRAGGGMAEARRCLVAAAANRVSESAMRRLVIRAATAIGVDPGRKESNAGGPLSSGTIDQIAVNVKRKMSPETVRSVDEALTSRAARKWWGGIPMPAVERRSGDSKGWTGRPR